MRTFLAVAAAALIAGTGAVAQQAQDQQAQGQQQAGLQVAEKQPFGKILTDAQGRALYMFTADQKGAKESTCYDACAQAWPPFVAQGQPNLGPQIDQAKVETFARKDGQMQVTYGGYPLYYFVKDTGPGQVTGQDKQGFGGEWYVMGPEGDVIRSEQKAEAADKN